MSLTAVIALLQAALTLLTLVSAHPELGDAARQNAMQVAQQAITSATQALATSNSSNQNTYNGNVSDLIHSQSCPHVDSPTCSTYGIATFDTNGCVTKYTCAPGQITTNTSSGQTAALCTYNGQTYSEGQTRLEFTGQYDPNCLVPGSILGCPIANRLICHNGQWVSGTQATSEPTTNGCGPLSGSYCGDLYCPNNAPQYRYYCHFGGPVGGQGWASFPCGNSCVVP